MPLIFEKIAHLSLIQEVFSWQELFSWEAKNRLWKCFEYS
jgi:hypothetical protein